MSITDELREYAGNFYFFRYKDVREKLDAIADRIDAEHDRALMEMRSQAYKDGFDAGFASADDWLAQHEDAMAEHGWVRLPVDADGETWHLGDVLMMMGEVCEVVGIGGHTIFYASRGGVEWTIAHNNRHYHAPTVEDVLRDMHMELDEVTALYVGEAIDSDERDRDEARIFAKYAARLQLREDA